VRRLDPAKPIDRRAAHVMLGRVPTEIDRLLAEKFGHDPQVAEKLQTLYPDGLPDADATAWRNRAHGDELDAAAALAAHHNDPNSHAAATRGQGLAAQQRGIATAVAGRQPPIVRRAEPHPTAGAQRRR
jgi:hypothetical protein